MLVVGLQACDKPVDAVTGTPSSGTVGAPTRFESSSGAVNLGAIGASQIITVTARDRSGNAVPGVSVTWTSSDETVADVAGSGNTAVVTARAPGRATIRARSGEVLLEFGVGVVAVRTITIAQAAVSVTIGAQRPLNATVDADPGALLDLRWLSENPLVASVNSQGTVTGVTPGTTTIRVNAVGDVRVTTTAQVTVTSAGTIALTPSTLSMGTGEQRTLAAAVNLEPGLSTALTWRSQNNTIATVSSTGVVTGVSVGSTLITAIAVVDSTRRSTAAVIIFPVVRDLDITPAAATLFRGDTRQLGVSFDADPGVSQAVVWRTSDAAVAAVSSEGLVSGVSTGTAIITAISAADTTKRATSLFTVRSSVTVNVSPTAATVDVGATRTIVATVTSENGLPTAITWRTSNASVASVSAAGVVTGVTAGTADVIAVSVADTLQRATSTITVAAVVRSVSVTPGSSSLQAGQTVQLAPTVVADAPLSTAVRYRSANSAVASVSASGLVTAVANGSTSIVVLSVADSSKRATSLVTVGSSVMVSVSPSAATVGVGATRTIVASVTSQNGSITAVTWRTSNASVVTVSAAGIVTGVSVGTADVIAVSLADSTRRATAIITVAAAVRSVNVTPGSSSLLPGQSVQLVPSVVADAPLTTAVSYRSSNSAVATVSAAGLVTAMATGNTSIVVLSVADTTVRATSLVSVSTGLASTWAATRLGGALYEDVVSLRSIDANSAFAVNLAGDVFRWNGSTWSVAARAAVHGTQFLAVHGSSTSNVMAVGTNGVTLYFDGSTWSIKSSGTANRLNSVFMESASSGFAVGANGTALRWNGTAWSVSSTGSSRALNSVWASGGIAFAVGATGEVLRFNGGWSRQTVPTTESLSGVSGTTSSNVVVVGTLGTVLSFNGSGWTSVNSNGIAGDLYAVSAVSPNDTRFYIASDDGLLLLNNGSLTRVTTPYTPRMFAVSIDAAGNAWAGGQRGSVQRLSGGSWETIGLAPDLIDAWTTSATNAWAVGEFGFIYRWNGTTWARQTAPTTATLNAVWGASATEAFAAGDNGTMLRFNGTSWTAMSFPSTASVYGLWGSSASNVYAVTAAGEVVRFNGASWAVVTSTGNALWAIHGTSPSDIVATGENGAALRFTGSSWSPITVSTTGTLAGVWSSSASAISVGAAASGSSGVAFSFNGTSWTSFSTGSSRVLTSIWGPNASDLYATGEQGTLLRFNGSAWSAQTTGTTDLLWSVTGAPGGSSGAFAVGYNSTVVAGSNGSSFSSAMVRGMTVARGIDLDPSAGARKVRGPLPSGKARKSHRNR
ncbi:beta strand repeat-containing protein [Gemmatimonas sp.]|uniref:beta strand repeat-containing protein n=1 Tax=Gemmatimonas sp. TaxID=1962908 RepID=UPI0035672E21